MSGFHHQTDDQDSPFVVADLGYHGERYRGRPIKALWSAGAMLLVTGAVVTGISAFAAGPAASTTATVPLASCTAASPAANTVPLTLCDIGKTLTVPRGSLLVDEIPAVSGTSHYGPLTSSDTAVVAPLDGSHNFVAAAAGTAQLAGAVNPVCGTAVCAQVISTYRITIQVESSSTGSSCPTANPNEGLAAGLGCGVRPCPSPSLPALPTAAAATLPAIACPTVSPVAGSQPAA